jgi:hypothetical protein
MSQNMYGNKSSFQRIGFVQEEVTFAAGALRHEKALIIAKKSRRIFSYRHVISHGRSSHLDWCEFTISKSSVFLITDNSE